MMMMMVMKTEPSVLSYHECVVAVGVVQRAEVGHRVLDQCSKDEAEADAQVHVYGLNEAVGIGQRRAGTHHQCGHSQDRGHAWNKHMCL